QTVAAVGEDTALGEAAAGGVLLGAAGTAGLDEDQAVALDLPGGQDRAWAGGETGVGAIAANLGAVAVALDLAGLILGLIEHHGGEEVVAQDQAAGLQEGVGLLLVVHHGGVDAAPLLAAAGQRLG